MMPEEPREEEEFKAAPLSLNSDLEQATVLSQVEERLARATSIKEIELWTKVREQIIRQDEGVKAAKQRRLLETIQIISKIGFSFGAFTLGIIFIFLGISGFGAVLTGAGIYLIAPKYTGEAFLNPEDRDSNRTTQRRCLGVGLILTLITIIALYAVGKTDSSVLNQVLLTISGMTTIATLAAFDQYRNFGIIIFEKPASDTQHPF